MHYTEDAKKVNIVPENNCRLFWDTHKKYSYTPWAKRSSVTVKSGRKPSYSDHYDLKQWFWNLPSTTQNRKTYRSCDPKSTSTYSTPHFSHYSRSIIVRIHDLPDGYLWSGNPRFKVLIICLHSDCISQEADIMNNSTNSREQIPRKKLIMIRATWWVTEPFMPYLSRLSSSKKSVCSPFTTRYIWIVWDYRLSFRSPDTEDHPFLAVRNRLSRDSLLHWPYLEPLRYSNKCPSSRRNY